MENIPTQSTKEGLAVLKKQRDAYVHKLFLLMPEFLFVFAVPALVAVSLGKNLDAGTGRTWTITLSIVAFVFSWAVAILRIRSVLARLKKYEDEIKES